MIIKKEGITRPFQYFAESLFFKIYTVIFLACLLPLITKAQERIVETINSNRSFYKGDASNLNTTGHIAVWKKYQFHIHGTLIILSTTYEIQNTYSLSLHTNKPCILCTGEKCCNA